MACLQCKDGYDLDSPTSCTAINAGTTPPAVADCKRHAAGKCVQCIDNFILDLTIATPKCGDTPNTYICQDKITNCVRCYQYKTPSGLPSYMCVKCQDGYIATIDGCVICEIDGCNYCEQRSALRSFTDYLTYENPVAETYKFQ